MDRITKSYFSEFQKSYGFDKEKDETIIFEHFCNYTILESRTDERFDIEAVNIGGKGTLGIDGFSILLNKQVVDTEDSLNDFLDSHKGVTAEIYFIQAKTSSKFEVKDIGNFGWAVSDFISEEPKINWTEVAKNKIKLFNLLIERVTELKEKPSCHLFYVTLGTKNEDVNINAKIDDIINDISSENLFAITELTLLGAVELQSNYKKIGQAISKSFEFPSRITLPEIKGTKEAYLGIIDALTITKLMTDDNGELLPNVFYDNVRDFQGGNTVNKEIKNTLLSDDKESFSILNNGITIVTENLDTTRNTFTISNYQIINGCQTSHVLLENKDVLNKKIQVPIKLISSDDRILTSKVIRSTNRQTEVKEQDLIAFTSFQKRLEDFYGTFDGKYKLFYERRSKQYNMKSVEKKRIIDKTTQIKAVASFFFDKPDMATRYFGTLFKEFGAKLFVDEHSMHPYYTATYILYNIDEKFRRYEIDKKYKKLKYFILMMIRHEINSEKPLQFNNKKIEAYCNNFIDSINSKNDFDKIINNIINKINSLKLDLNDNELSKSKQLVKDLLNKYDKKKK